MFSVFLPLHENALVPPRQNGRTPRGVRQGEHLHWVPVLDVNHDIGCIEYFMPGEEKSSVWSTNNDLFSTKTSLEINTISTVMCCWGFKASKVCAELQHDDDHFTGSEWETKHRRPKKIQQSALDASVVSRKPNLKRSFKKYHKSTLWQFGIQLLLTSILKYLSPNINGHKLLYSQKEMHKSVQYHFKQQLQAGVVRTLFSWKSLENGSCEVLAIAFEMKQTMG